MEIKNKFNEFLNNNLNEEQLKAVTQKSGALLTIAGAGSGKTRVITTRITHLILNENVPHHAIVALTFTNKAAKEMQERIAHFLGGNFANKNSIKLPFIGTFHAYCLQLLKKNQELLDNPFFSILDEDDQHKILSGIIHRNGLQKEITVKNLSYQISHIKNQALQPDLIAQMYAINPKLHDLFNAYEAEKKASKCLDFDDLLLETLKLFKNNVEFKNNMQETIKHVLVDEYQDTNVIQHELLKNIAKNSKNNFAIDSICVVGDEDQSIYSWRGATIANIINFKKDFPKAVTIKIEQNYRSVQSILDIANNVINNNKQRNPKRLWSERKGTDRIRQLTCLTEYQEGDLIAYCASVIAKQGNLSSTAVLYRTHFQSRAIEEALIKNAIPYKILGGTQFYERKEIKDLLAYLRLIINPFDRASFFRVINTPARGLGLKFEEQFHALWHEQAFLTFHDIAKKMIEDKEVTGSKKDALVQFLTIFQGLQPSEKPSKVLDAIIAKVGYITYIKSAYDPEDAQIRVDNIKELLNAIKHLEATQQVTIDSFLQDVALMQEAAHRKSEDREVLLLMTLHAAKGLEFDTVILCGMEDGLLPSSRSLAQQATLEEERRLFYVGITRAKERLLLTHTRYRYAYKNMADQFPSRFLDEIPAQLIKKENCSYWKHPDFNSYFSQWFDAKHIKPTEHVVTFGPSKKIEHHRTQEPTKTKKIDVVKSTSNKFFGSFKLNQPVHHEKFGVGIIKTIDVKSDTTTYITVAFKSGNKKVDAKFLKAT